MPTTSTFIVNSSTKLSEPIQDNPQSYFNKDWNSPFYGTADLIIDVFATSNHLIHAKDLLAVLKQSGLDTKYYHIKIEIKS